MNYVKTQFGDIHIRDLPLVTQQTTNDKFKTAFMFFSIIVIVLIIFLYIIEWPVSAQHNTKKLNIENFTNKVTTSVVASAIDVYADDLQLENIILITTDNNIIDINIFTNKYIKVAKKEDSIMYSLDFTDELEIKEIILISDADPDNYIKHVNIDLHNYLAISDIHAGSKVWEYNALLPNLRENSILISKQVFVVSDWHVNTLSNAPNGTQKIIANERELSLTLTENSEEYSSY